MPGEELGAPVTISSIAWQHSNEGDTTAWYGATELYVGLCPDDELSAFFDQNYVPGTRTLVLEADSLVLTAGYGEWVTFDLPEPFAVPSGSNLLIELVRAEGDGFFFTWRWYTQGFRTLSADSPEAAAGYLDNVSSMLLIGCGQSLQPVSWGSLKAGLPE